MLAGAMDKFHYLWPALAVALVFVGVKMVMVDVYKLPVAASLSIIAGILAVAILVSLWQNRREYYRLQF